MNTDFSAETLRRGATLICGDAPKILGKMPPEVVDLVVTSPPYDDLRHYGGHKIWDFEATAIQLFRALKPGGIVCWNIGDSVVNGSETLTSCKQKIFFREVAGFTIHDTMIYEKSNFSHPERVRYHQTFEYVFVLSKGRPRVFNPIKDKPNLWAGTGTFGRNTVRLSNGEMGLRKRNIIEPNGMRTNVWRGKTRGQEELCQSLPHPAMMPKWLARDLILSWSNPGDLVCDPFVGSGTVLQQALETGRRVLGIDSNPQYIRRLRGHNHG